MLLQTTYDYTLDSNVMGRVHQVNDLGVVLDKRLLFTHNIHYVYECATRIMGFIYRNTTNITNIDTLLSLNYTYVRSKLEYCSVIWDPFYMDHVDVIDRKQRKFCKRLYYVKHGP